LFLALGAGCEKEVAPEPEPEPDPVPIPTTYRVISGLSMGGIGTAALGLRNPERFDGVGILGGPLDAALLLRTIDRFHLGGFCSRQALASLLAEDPSLLNDPAAIDACAQRTPTITWEHDQHFNRWVYTTNGGTFDRSAYLNMFRDLTLAYGNLLYENPDSPYAPPGVDPERLRHSPADFCTHPTVVQGVYNLEHNPDGAHPAITFCDGEPATWICQSDRAVVDFCSDPANKGQPLDAAGEAAFAQAFCAGRGGALIANKKDHPLILLDNGGRVDACRLATRPITVALALDLNRNGRRDFGEPVINNGFERFDDWGSDGCPDPYEDGEGGCRDTPDFLAQDPNGDNYDAANNPLGTEGNWQWDEGEPFRDDGLDGVPGTGDFGEGNGVYDVSSGRRALLAHDARTNYRKLDASGRARLNFLLDGGIRDLFNFGLGAKQIWGLVNHFRPDQTGYYRDFKEIPGVIDGRTGEYRPWNAPWERAPKNLAVFYGSETPTDAQRVEGEGDHVGNTEQAVLRVYNLFNWAAAQWPSLERPKTPVGGMSYTERERLEWYDSALLRGKREYGVFLPPGYELPENEHVRYPVLFMLHGYGMDPAGFVASSLIADSYMKDTTVSLRPMIIVFPSGRCCFENRATGERDCREKDDDGVSFNSKPGFERECHSGNFYVNRRGYTHDDAVPYGDAFFELMEEIDRRYRTLGPAEVQTR
jgi:hypothetical protein